MSKEAKKMSNEEKYARIKLIGDTLEKGEILDGQTKQMVPLTDEMKNELRKEQYKLNAELASDNAWSEVGHTFLQGLAWGAGIAICIWGGALLFTAIAGNGESAGGGDNA